MPNFGGPCSEEVFSPAGLIGCFLLCIILGACEAFTMYVLSKFAERYQAPTYSGLIRKALGRKLSASAHLPNVSQIEFLAPGICAIIASATPRLDGTHLSVAAAVASGLVCSRCTLRDGGAQCQTL